MTDNQLPEHVEIVAINHVVRLDDNNNPKDMVEVSFKFGASRSGKIYVDPRHADKSHIRQSVLDYLERFDL